MPRADDKAWRDALSPKPKPSPKAPRAKRAAQTPPAPGEKVPLSTYLPRGLLADLHQLAARLYAERGCRVTLADLIAEAVADLLRKHSR